MTFGSAIFALAYELSRCVEGILCCWLITFLGTWPVLFEVAIELDRDASKISFTSLVKLLILTIVDSCVAGPRGVYTPVTPLLGY